MDADGPVVAGVDGSAAALDALRHAAGEAARRGCPLRIVHALDAGGTRGWPLDPAAIVHTAALEARDRQPLLEIGTFVAVGPVGPVLAAESAFARLVVVGAHAAPGGFTVLTGSTSAHLSVHGLSPILVVREGERRGTPHGSGPVVVGLSGTAGGYRAVTVAAAEAAERGTRLVAVEVGTGPADGRARAAVTACRHDHPDLAVRADPGPHSLADASRDAVLVVVDALDTVTVRALRDVRCPVLVTPYAFAGTLILPAGR